MSHIKQDLYETLILKNLKNFKIKEKFWLESFSIFIYISKIKEYSNCYKLAYLKE